MYIQNKNVFKSAKIVAKVDKTIKQKIETKV